MSPKAATRRKPSEVAERDNWDIQATGEAVSDEAIAALARLLLSRVDRQQVEEVDP